MTRSVTCVPAGHPGCGAIPVRATLFLGGGANWLTFLPKIFAVVALPMAVAYVFPRYRTEDVVRLMWKWPVLVALMGLAVIMK